MMEARAVLGPNFLKWRCAVAVCTCALYLADMRYIMSVQTLDEPPLHEGSYFFRLLVQRIPRPILIEDRRAFQISRCQARYHY